MGLSGGVERGKHPEVHPAALVENSISHGFEKREGEGRISIRFSGERKGLTICVEDDGQGMTTEKLLSLRQELDAGERRQGIRKGHIGISNVHRS